MVPKSSSWTMGLPLWSCGISKPPPKAIYFWGQRWPRPELPRKGSEAKVSAAAAGFAGVSGATVHACPGAVVAQVFLPRSRMVGGGGHSLHGLG